MKIHKNISLIWLILLLWVPARAALRADLVVGYCSQSHYHYFDEHPDTSINHWLIFNSLNDFKYSGSFALDIYHESMSVGIYTAFLRRYNLMQYNRDSVTGRIDSYAIGQLVSMPLITYLEVRQQRIFWQCGLGPFISRFNYNRADLPEFFSTSFFGFLFAAGYEQPIAAGLSIVAKGELLLNAPVFLIDFVDSTVQTQIAASRFSEYNRYDYQSIFYNYSVSIGLRYTFCNSAGIYPQSVPLWQHLLSSFNTLFNQ